jgi:ribonuclease HI
MHEHLKPFLQKALKARRHSCQTVCRLPRAPGKQKKMISFLPPILRGVRQNLIKTNRCIQTSFNHVVNTLSQNIDKTLKPLALNALINNASLPFKGCTHKRLNDLFESLENCLFVSLDELFPLFHVNYAGNEAWTAMKGLKYLDPKQMCEISGLKALYHLPYLIDSTKAYQKHLDQSSIILLGELVAHFAFSLLKPYQRDSEATLETSSSWGNFKKGSVAATSIFVDGSCLDKNIFPVEAGFALCVPCCFNLKQNASPNLIIKSRISGSQTSACAEAFAILAALMLTSDLSPLKIYTNCLSPVISINRFSQTPPQPHEKAKMPDQSLLLRMLNLLKMRRNKVEVLYLSNHRPDPRNKLTTYSVIADREAKLSLNSQIVSVPDEKMHLDDPVLYVCTDGPSEANRFTVQENNPTKFFQTIFQETRQTYLRHGKWHNYLLHFSIWQDASFSILHLKKGKASVKKFIIQTLGRTLPTNHRLNVVHSKIYREKSCFLCQADDESIEHIFFQCSHFHDSRLAIKKETIKISFDAISKIDIKDMRHGASKPNLTTITEQIAKLFFPPEDLLPEDYRMLSAGQIPCLFQEWLNSFITDQKSILKIGKTVHEHLITSYQKIWKYRCSNNSALSMDFRSRLATFPRGVPVHELTKTIMQTTSNFH